MTRMHLISLSFVISPGAIAYELMCVQARLVNDVEENFAGVTKEFDNLKNSCFSSCLQVSNNA